MAHTFQLISALSAALSAAPVLAQGIPVIDVANLAQTVQQVVNDITQINNQVAQIQQMQQQIQASTGSRNLGTVFNNPLLKNYVPAEAYTLLNASDSSGYVGLSTTAKVLRDRGMVYNCLDLNGEARNQCQARLAQPYQHKGLLQDAMRAAAGRLTQIQTLMAQVNATTDQKSVLEVQARIGAENALLSHEMSQIQMLQGMADSEERIARSRDRERQYQMLSRRGKVSDFLP
ncbi:type IV secretion system protein [Paucibacter sp. DJ2R-2]|uniref:type IV secretion system protein n=1 Tax=Paucibacter sp. DJ2R-2 TaxID=2893558 RepID=UPI0021E4EF31|nr:type IV secretion system protein [Paucibacter sp. DJ2R-2]MCV2438582.1 type IV secretion system protein [Paucibacter sp. DJ2R-2]